MAKRRGKDVLSEKDKRPLNKDNFKKLSRIFKYVLPYKGTFAIGLFCLLFSSVVLLAFPYLSGKLVDAAMGTSTFYLEEINQIALALVGVLVVQSIFSFFRVYLFAQVSERSMADLRGSVFSKFMVLPITFYDKSRSGELLSRITTDVSLLQDTFSITLAEFIRQIATLIIGIIIIFYATPQLSLFMLATLPIIIIIAMVFGKHIRKLSKKTQDELAKANTIVEETLQAVNTVKAFTNEFFEIKRYKGSLATVVDVALKGSLFRAAFISFIILGLFGAIVAIMWYGAKLVQSGDMTVGDLLSFVLYTTFIGGSIAGLGDLYGQIQKSIGASERVLEITEMDGEMDSKKENTKSLKLNGSISYQNVGFAYPTRKDLDVLKNITLDIAPGEKVALVGHSGVGKSTIIQLLMRFYNVDKGSINIDGKDASAYDLKAYRENIGIVPQEVLLFGGTIRENIAYGKPGASEDEIRDAAQKANALQFIETFPEGLDTLVGERGVKLSGGQRQRVAIARAILKDPSILILDEATSSLDAESEQLVQETLNKLILNHTTIIIAHRLATIRKVDRIYVIDGGQVTESGTHEELSSLDKGIYSNLVKLQFQEG